MSGDITDTFGDTGKDCAVSIVVSLVKSAPLIQRSRSARRRIASIRVMQGAVY